MNLRSYSDYNRTFENGFKSFLKLGPTANFADALSTIHKSNQPMRILDEGAGRGYFLAELKEILKKRGIKTITTALTLHNNPELENSRRAGMINEVVVGNAEFFVPKKPFDAIFSMYGSLGYTLPQLRKEHLLKFAYSLRRGGIMMVGFKFKYEGIELSDVNRGLSGNPKKQRDISKGLSLENEMEGIERTFEKRWFDAKFYSVEGTRSMPNWMLIVRRR